MRERGDDLGERGDEIPQPMIYRHLLSWLLSSCRILIEEIFLHKFLMLLPMFCLI